MLLYEYNTIFLTISLFEVIEIIHFVSSARFVRNIFMNKTFSLFWIIELNSSKWKNTGL